MKGRVFLKTFIILIILVFSIFSIVVFWLNRPTGNIPVTGIEFQVKKGYTTHTVADLLYKNRYIHSKLLFVSIVRLLNLDKELKIGYFFIESDSSTFKIINSIYNGKFVTVSFMIPEGYSFKQIKETLINLNVLTEEEIEDFFSLPDYKERLGISGFPSIEGLLGCDTYVFNKGSSAETIFKGMVNLFFKKLEQIYPDYKNMPKKDLYEKIILASIIEKEVKNHNESKIVAGIFYNRLKIKMRLQSCATVQYILGKPKEHLLESDLLIDNPYNTYLYYGLPPTAICNPGVEALKASFFPAKHNYLFFVVKDPVEGTHYFSETYEEHLLAQKKYKAIKGLY